MSTKKKTRAGRFSMKKVLWPPDFTPTCAGCGQSVEELGLIVEFRYSRAVHLICHDCASPLRQAIADGISFGKGSSN